MNSFWRTLESWTTQQDYIWFLALLAWSGVIAAEFRQIRGTDEPTRMRWLVAFAGCCIAGILVQLVLLAQNILTPYMKLDFAMGAAQAGGTAALMWGATAGARRALAWRIMVGTILATLAVARWWWPVEAGVGLALLQAIAVWALIRLKPGSIPKAVAGLLVLVPIIATHGPWAYAIGHGRRAVDWSHFALAEASCWFVMGIGVAVTVWRQRWEDIVQRHGKSDRLLRDVRRAFLALGCWLICGLGLAVWYGRQTRQAYETYLLRRTELMLQTLDSKELVDALGPELKITKIELMHYSTGGAVDVATVPRTADPLYADLRTKMRQILKLNTDIRDLHILTLRQGEVLLLESSLRQEPAITHVVHHHATRTDYEHAQSPVSFIDGPIRTVMTGTRFAANAPITDPATGKVLGWLGAQVSATAWAASFTMARLQTMALVAVGVGFWTLSIAYRLRRDAREDAERKAAESAAANRMKSTFLAKVSHELRTPIQSVLGYSELLADASLPEPQSAWVAAVRSHGTVMLRLVNDLIDLGALQSGAFRLEVGPVDLRNLLDDCMAALRPAAGEKNLTLETVIMTDAPDWVQGDGVRLRQILLNLLTNAVKFTPAGTITLTMRRNAHQVDFMVADTGPGIAPALRDRLFQPFARLDPTAPNGSGLGLALVHGLVQAMGGKVWLDQSVAAGATFVVQVPLAPCTPPGPATAPVATSDVRSQMTVLVAEDNTLVRELLVTFLKGQAANVLVASDGILAVKLAREHRPDVLLLDIGLPGQDGFEVAESLRRDGPRELRIIGLSAHAGAHDETRARIAGMNAFLTKPVSLARLAQALNSTASLPTGSPVTADPQLRRKLAAEFSRETPQVVEEMHAAIAANNWSRVRNRAHYLKNSADVIGAAALQDACRQIMMINHPPDPAVVRQLIEAIVAAIPASDAIAADAAPTDPA